MLKKNMELAVLIAERKIEEGLENGFFANLPHRDRIDCSLSGEAFIAKWWREKIMRDEQNRR